MCGQRKDLVLFHFQTPLQLRVTRLGQKCSFSGRRLEPGSRSALQPLSFAIGPYLVRSEPVPTPAGRSALSRARHAAPIAGTYGFSASSGLGRKLMDLQDVSEASTPIGRRAADCSTGVRQCRSGAAAPPTNASLAEVRNTGGVDPVTCAGQPANERTSRPVAWGHASAIRRSR